MDDSEKWGVWKPKLKGESDKAFIFLWAFMIFLVLFCLYLGYIVVFVWG